MLQLFFRTIIYHRIVCRFVCKNKKPLINYCLTSGYLNYQCPEQDSNLHSRKATGPWNQRVYQFHHLGRWIFNLCDECPGQDSNLHILKDTSPSSWRVYQFHHLGKAGAKIVFFWNDKQWIFKYFNFSRKNRKEFFTISMLNWTKFHKQLFLRNIQFKLISFLFWIMVKK